MDLLTVEQEYRRQKKRWDMFADGGTGVKTGKGGVLADCGTGVQATKKEVGHVR